MINHIVRHSLLKNLFAALFVTGIILFSTSSWGAGGGRPPFVTACSRESIGASCSFHRRDGRAIEGTCQEAPRRFGLLICRPGHSGQDRSQSSERLTERGCDCTIKGNLRYRDTHGWDSKFAELDIYYRAASGQRPILLFIHGGGWVTGDKANIEKNPNLINSFLNTGFVVASVNFRLIEKKRNSEVKYWDMVEDIARSMKWLSEHAHEYGAKPNAFVLVGYSSGAHLASLIATDESYLRAQGLFADIILGVSAWDVPAYDIPLALKLMKGTALENKIPINKILFGSTTEEQKKASPRYYLDSGAKIPFQLLSAGIKEGKRQTLTKDTAEAFKEALINAGHEAEHHHYENSEHSDLPLQYGKGTIDIQEKVEGFLKSPCKLCKGTKPNIF